MTVREWAADAETRVRRAAPKTKSKQDADYRGADIEYLGVRAPEYRQLARECDCIPDGKWAAYTEAICKQPVYELRILAHLIAARHKREFMPGHWPLFQKWLGRCRGWALTDSLCCEVIGHCIVKFPALAAKTRFWVRSTSLWTRRASLVSFCVPLRAGFSPRIVFANTEALLADRDPMIVKAISWVLRESAKMHPNELSQFMREHESAIASQVLREVRTKIRTGTKSGRSVSPSTS